MDDAGERGHVVSSWPLFGKGSSWSGLVVSAAVCDVDGAGIECDDAGGDCVVEVKCSIGE
jgi:hypothetical protein